MKKLFLTIGLAAITAIGWGQSQLYTVGAAYSNGIFFKTSGGIQINDSTVSILGFTYDIVPSSIGNTGTIYITDGVQTGKLVISRHTSPKKVKGFIPNYDIVHIVNINNSTSVIYYGRKN